jgi:predicted aconitase
VAQTNAGYGYICRTLEALGIDPGLACTRYALEMDKKEGQSLSKKEFS